MGSNTLKKAVFLDRDGVLNPNVLNPVTGLMESPHKPEEFELSPTVAENLVRLQKAGYLLFVVSNQPSYAKGKTSLENLNAIAAKFEQSMKDAGVKFSGIYYCLHHPEGVVKDYSGPCSCRKPSPFFLLKAAKDFNLDLANSWMIGDRPTDIQCGQAVHTKTIFMLTDTMEEGNKPISADYVAMNLDQVVYIILSAE